MTANIYEFPTTAPPDAPLVNLSYANGFLPQTYSRALEPLFAKYRVISAHMRPMWQPSCPPESLHDWHQLGDDLLALTEPLSSSPIIGIGHSVGAIATVYAAAARPDRFRAVILLDPTFLSPSTLWLIAFARLVHREARMPLVQGALKRGRHWDSTEAAFIYFRGKKLFVRWSDEAVRTYTESITAPDPQGGVRLIYPPEWEARIYETIPPDVWRYPAKLKPPTLVIRGQLSDTFLENNAQRFARLNPRAKIVIIKGAGHLVAQEQPEAVGSAIYDFLDHVAPVAKTLTG